mmetsp:Transcript_9061/g.37286  ORF Transcript_9061/g.37286 Transcript_9061/m.37286 type:complete len:201 (-) Transcript_9061:241-843(-)
MTRRPWPRRQPELEPKSARREDLDARLGHTAAEETTGGRSCCGVCSTGRARPSRSRRTVCHIVRVSADDNARPVRCPRQEEHQRPWSCARPTLRRSALGPWRSRESRRGSGRSRTRARRPRTRLGGGRLRRTTLRFGSSRSRWLDPRETSARPCSASSADRRDESASSFTATDESTVARKGYIGAKSTADRSTRTRRSAM